MASVVDISHIFEESSCCLCGRTKVDQFLRISDNFIKYKSELISMVEVIRQTLDFELRNDSNALGMCRLCKVKLVDFYHFKTKSQEVKDFLMECSGSAEILLQKRLLDTLTKDKAVYNTMEIVRDYVKKHPVTEIKVDETAGIIILKSKKKKKSVQSEDKNGTFAAGKIVEVDVIPESGLMDVGAYAEIEGLQSEFISEFDNLVVQEHEFLDYEVDEMFPKYCDVAVSGSDTNNILSEIIEQERKEINDESDDSDVSYYQQSVSDDSSGSKKNNKTRSRNPETWKCNKRKSLRNSGQAYIASNGKLMEARKMRESCGSSCRNKCITKITEEDRKRAFETIWGFGDIVKQRKWLSDRILSAEPKRRRTSNSKRRLIRQFYLDARGKNSSDTLVQVCKKMFGNTLVVSSQMIQGVVNKYSKQGFTDSRGKFERKISDGKRFAIEHVKRFPFFYIERKLTKIQCYRMYRNECMEKRIDPINLDHYRDIFDKPNSKNTENVDCEFCNRYSEATDEMQASMRDEYYEHLNQETNKMCQNRALGAGSKREDSQRRSTRIINHN